MKFRVWLEGIEEYDPYRKIISQRGYGRSFTFDNWFSEGERIYLPFNGNMESSEYKDLEKDLASAFEDFGFEVVDLKQGYARQKGKTNLYKIGKLIDNLQYKDLKQREAEFQSGKYSKIKHESEVRMINKYWQDLRERFNQRGTSGEFLVVISKNIHDIASMSTGRGWTSCMTLGSGSHHEDVYCEVANGGFVAYLIRSNDKNIEHPVSRIHIRRFDNKSGKSIAMPEESMYGEEVPAFMSIVKNWIQSKQGKTEPGKYTRTGGKYSDTWGDSRKTFLPPDPSDMNRIGVWLTKWLNLDKEDQKKYYQYFLKGIQSFFQSKEEFPPRFVQKLKNFIFDSTSTFYSGHWNQGTGQFQSAFALKYPKTISEEDFVKAFHNSLSNQDQLDKLIKSFPQYMTDDLFKSIKDHSVKEKIVKSKPEFSQHLDDDIKANAEKNIRIDNPEFAVSDSNSIYHTYGNITSELDKLQRLNPIPEPLIRQIVDFANKKDQLKLSKNRTGTNPLVKPAEEAEVEQIRDEIVGHIIYIFNMTGSDTPTVQRFYQSLLPDWDKLGGVGILGSAIARLGENGRQFLPFIEKKYAELQNIDKEYLNDIVQWERKQYEKELESYNYVIDALKSGSTRSSKYEMSYGKGFEWHRSQKENEEKKMALRKAIIKGK